jgi:hypothetical protein
MITSFGSAAPNIILKIKAPSEAFPTAELPSGGKLFAIQKLPIRWFLLE